MKSGKYVLGYKQTLKTLRNGKSKLVIIATTLHRSASQRSSTTPCWPRLESTTTLATTMNLEPLVESTSEFVLSPSQIPETLTSSEPCLVLRKLVNKLSTFLISMF